MKKKINITFEVSTEVEIDLPDNGEISAYVSDNYKEIVEQAKKNIIDGGIENQLTWGNCSWGDDDEVIDLDKMILGE